MMIQNIFNSKKIEYLDITKYPIKKIYINIYNIKRNKLKIQKTISNTRCNIFKKKRKETILKLSNLLR